VALLVSVSPRTVRADEDVCATLAQPRPARQPQLFYVKSKNVLCLVEGARVVWSRQASHGRAEAKKRFEGDERTPEGRYTVSPARKVNGSCCFFRSPIPTPTISGARAAGRRAGSGVGIHGPQRWYAFLGQAQALTNHSDGCIVLDEQGIRELAARVTRPIILEIVADVPR
jgi:hypothetical protein